MEVMEVIKVMEVIVIIEVMKVLEVMEVTEIMEFMEPKLLEIAEIMADLRKDTDCSNEIKLDTIGKVTKCVL